jgi:polysaccharide deacetylase family protein (PEP-CTERM system associated)
MFQESNPGQVSLAGAGSIFPACPWWLRSGGRQEADMDSLTIDVEEWFHILDSNVVPPMDRWPALEARVEGNTSRLLDLLAACRVQATFFWLGWVAERHKSLLRRCLSEGHEIASHGYAHLLAYQVGRRQFHQDVLHAKSCLQDIAGVEVRGFRAAGFGITSSASWAFDVIREVGHLYDASVFPAPRAHGGIAQAQLVPYIVPTGAGELYEVPISVIEWWGRRVSLFGGGYLRLAPKLIIRWGTARLKAEGRPLVVYIHPRDIDPHQPRLPLPPFRRFKCYVNLRTTFSKIKWLCAHHQFTTLAAMVASYEKQAHRPAGSAPRTTQVGAASGVWASP